jgi:hypothetical protein
MRLLSVEAVEGRPIDDLFAQFGYENLRQDSSKHCKSAENQLFIRLGSNFS